MCPHGERRNDPLKCLKILYEHSSLFIIYPGMIQFNLLLTQKD